MTSRQRTRDVVTIVVGVACIAALLGAAYVAKRIADGRSAAAVTNTSPTPVRVSVIEVAPRSLPNSLELRGFLEGFAEVRVHAEVAGRVVQRQVNDGQAVAQGDVLCRIDDTFHGIALARAEANLRAANAEHQASRSAVQAAAARLEEIQALRLNARIEFDRIAELHAQQNAPQIEYDRLDAALQRATAAVREAEASLMTVTQKRESAAAAAALAEAEVNRAGETLARCEIRSPLAGRIDRMLIDQGEYVSPGQPIADVIRLDRLKLFVECDTRRLGLLGDNPTVEVVADGSSDQVYRAVLDHVAPRADPVSRKFRLEVHVDNPDGALLAGMFATCRLTAAQPRESLLLPTTAVVRRFGRDYCHVVTASQDGTHARLTPIETRPLPDQLEFVEVLAGLKPGERVVLESQAELRDGDVVAIALPRADPFDLALSPAPTASESSAGGG